MKIEDLLLATVESCIFVILIFVGIGIFMESCDVYENWTCGITDDGFHDGEFNWRHGVFPW